MEEKYIKIRPTEKLNKIMEYAPACNLLIFIATKLINKNDNIDKNFAGLKKDEVSIIDYNNIGLSRKQYNTAKKLLRELEIISTRGKTLGSYAKIIDNKTIQII